MKTNWLIPVILILAPLFVLGCYETKLDYTVNPGGSGKVVVEVRAASVMDMNTSAAAGSSLAKEVLKNSSGIDTWKDIEFKKTDDGKNYFKGTAYFSDITKARFKNISMMDSVVFYKDDKNNLVLEMNNDSKSESKPDKKPSLSNEEVEKTINEQKAQFQQMKPMLAAFLGTMKTELTFQMPGKLEKSTNFKKDKSGNLSLKFEGEKFINVLDKVMADDAWWRQQVLAGSDMKKSPPSGYEINEQLFGEKGPVRATFKGKFKDLFDYNQEMAAAKANYDAMISALGLMLAEEAVSKPVEKVENYSGGNFTDVRIVRIALSNMTDPDYNMFGNDQSYRVSVMGFLPGSVLSADRAVVTQAVADNGDNLLHPDEWNRETTFIQLSQNKTALLWDVPLALPDRSVKSIKELTGFVYASSSSGAKWIETGIKEFKEGARGSAVDVVIESIKPNGTSEEMNLKFTTSCNLIKEVEFYDAAGKKIEAQRYSSSDYGEGCTLSYYLEGNFPPKGSIKVEMYENVTKLEIPFSIRNVDLFGNPVK
jgi:hypothetical protein